MSLSQLTSLNLSLHVYSGRYKDRQYRYLTYAFETQSRGDVLEPLGVVTQEARFGAFHAECSHVTKAEEQ